MFILVNMSRRTCDGCIPSCCVVVTVSFDVAFSRSTCRRRRPGYCSSRWRSACRSSCTSRTGTWRRTSPGLQRNIALPLVQFRLIFGSGKHHNLLAVLHQCFSTQHFYESLPRKTSPCSMFARLCVCVIFCS